MCDFGVNIVKRTEEAYVSLLLGYIMFCRAHSAKWAQIISALTRSRTIQLSGWWGCRGGAAAGLLRMSVCWYLFRVSRRAAPIGVERGSRRCVPLHKPRRALQAFQKLSHRRACSMNSACGVGWILDRCLIWIRTPRALSNCARGGGSCDDAPERNI